MFVKLKTKRVIASLLIICMIMTSNSLFSFANSLGNGNNLDETEVSESVSENIDTTDDEFELPSEIDLESETKTAVDEMDGEALDTPDVNEEEEELEAESETESLDIESTEEENTETVDEEKVSEEKENAEQESTEQETETSEAEEVTPDVKDEEVAAADDNEEFSEATVSETKQEFDEMLFGELSDNSIHKGKGTALNPGDTPLDQDGFNNLNSYGSYYLTEDVTFNDLKSISNYGKINICLHGHRLTIGDSAKFYLASSNMTIFDCGEEEIKGTVELGNLSVSTNAMIFNDVNVETKNITINKSKIEFNNCSFTFFDTEADYLISIDDNSSLTIDGIELDEKKGFLVNNKSKLNLKKISVSNSLSDSVFNISNESEVTIDGKDGKCIFEGNKSIFTIDNSKLYLLNGSGNAMDKLRENGKEEYSDYVITKKGTSLLDPDFQDMNIVFKRNVGSYVIGATNNSYVMYDAVIIANEFSGEAGKIGAYVSLDDTENNMVLINKAYVNQNNMNIVVKETDRIYGSYTKDDGSFETLNRDATLSFYPTKENITILRDVIKPKESSFMFRARDYKSDDEWVMISEKYLFKACMLQGVTDDFYLETVDENIPAKFQRVYVDPVNKGSYEIGSFYLKDFVKRSVRFRFNLRDDAIFKEETVAQLELHYGNTNAPEFIRDEKGNVKQIEINYIPFDGDEEFSEIYSLISNGVQWIDSFDGYEYKFTTWSTTQDRKVTEIDGGDPVSRGALENKIDDIIGKYSNFKYREDVVDLYDTYTGHKKYLYNFVAHKKYFDKTNERHIEKWEIKKEYNRHYVTNYAMPYYNQPDDYIYKGFEVIGFQYSYLNNETADYSINIKDEPYRSGVSQVHNYHFKELEDGADVMWYAVFQGESHKINYYLKSEGIKALGYVKVNADGYYVTKATLSEPYSKLQPQYYNPTLHMDFNQFYLEDGLEFLGWTKKDIRRPVTDAELAEIEFVSDYMSFQSNEDCYYYPVLHAEVTTASHENYTAITQVYMDSMVQFDTGMYELTKDIRMVYPRAVYGDVVIDLHGHELTMNDGAYFFGFGNLTFTDCKYNETDKKKWGSIYNGNGDIYNGTGKLTFNQMTFRGKIAHKFTNLNTTVTIDNVRFHDNEYVGIFSDITDDRYPRLMQIDNSKVEIINTTIDNVKGRIVATNESDLSFKNFTMKNCIQEEINDQKYHIIALGESNITLNAPCWFENNSIIFKIEYSKVDINSEGKFDSEHQTLESIKDNSVIFTKNHYETIFECKQADIELSGIFKGNYNRLPIIRDTSKITKIHYDGYTYVKENTGSNGDVGLPMMLHEDYSQEEDDEFDFDSEIDYWAYYWGGYFTCDPFSCRDYKFISNMTKEEANQLKRNSEGEITNFKLINDKYARTGTYYRPVLDGINYNKDTNRGFEVFFNYEAEQEVIDVNLLTMSSMKGMYTFRYTDGTEIPNAVFRYFRDKTKASDTANGIRSYQEFIEWLANPVFEFISDEYKNRYEFKRFLYIHGAMQEESFIDGINFEEARLPFRFEANFKYVGPINSYTVRFNTKDKLPKNKFNEYFEKGSRLETGSKNNINVYDTTKSVLIDAELDVANDPKFPFEIDYWLYTDSDRNEYKIYPGSYVNFFADYEPDHFFDLTAVYKMKNVNVKFIFNQNVRYEGSKDTKVVIASVGQAVKLITEDYIDVADNFVFFGWIEKKDYREQYINGVKLPDYMWAKNWADELRSNNRMLMSSIYLNGVSDIELVPVYYFISSNFLNPNNSNAIRVTPRSSGGSGGGGGGGGGSAAAPTTNADPFAGNTYTANSFLDVLRNAINNLMNPQNNQATANNQQAVAGNAQAAAINGPTTDNPFAAKTEINELGVAVTQTNEQVGFEQFGKAMATMQQAAATGQTDKANVSQVSMSVQDANWTQAADGSWSLSSNNAMNAGEVKNTWQPVTDATGKANWYKFDANGKMQTGWIVDDNKAYYLLESGANQGALVKGVTLDIGGFKFSFDNTGALVDLKAGN